MTDHKAEAEKNLALAIKTPDYESAVAWTSAAQVHASLYLAEQQRVANLIAYIRDVNDSSDALLVVIPQIKEALGLA